MKASGDFSAEFGLVGISAIALVIGAFCSIVAVVLLRLIDPGALGVGYDIIDEILFVLAPLLIMGSALWPLVSFAIPGEDHSLWALVGMAAVLAGTMRAPLTSVIFTLELTHDVKTLRRS